jgi:hypothetical protein
VSGRYGRFTVPRVSVSTDTLPGRIQQVLRLVHVPVDFAAMAEVDLTAIRVAVGWELDQ